MKKLTLLIWMLLPLLAPAKVPVSVVEQKYIAALSESFDNGRLSAPRSPLYWSLCLGETTELNKTELAKRIAALSNDTAARTAFYRRLNFYRGFKADPMLKDETYGVVYLPYESKPKKTAGKDQALRVLSYDKPEVMLDDWLAYSDYVTAFGEDSALSTKWADYAAGNTPDNKDKIFTFTEINPQFPGGDKALMKFLQWQIQYPMMERDNDIQGKVLLHFVVCPDGHISAGSILRSISPGLDKEAMLMLKMLPTFAPGNQSGTNVAVYYNLPIVFRLQ